MVLPDGHRSGWLQDGDRVAGDPRGHLTGYRLDDAASGGDGGEGDGGLLLQACRNTVCANPAGPPRRPTPMPTRAAAGSLFTGGLDCGFKASALGKTLFSKEKSYRRNTFETRKTMNRVLEKHCRSLNFNQPET